MENVNTYQFLSTLEKKVHDWLTKNDILFTTQETMFGSYGELGSATVDFVLPDRNLVLRVMGSFWHSSMEAKARDEFGKEQLLNAGYQVVDLWEENLDDTKIGKTMRKALRGEEVLR